MQDTQANSIWGFPLCGPDNRDPPMLMNQLAIDYSVNHGISFHNSLVNIATAHHDNAQGSRFVYYGSPIGKGVVRLFFLCDNLNSTEDKDNYLQIKTSPPEIADQAIKDFNKGLLSKVYYRLQYRPEYSFIDKKNLTVPSQFIIYFIIEMSDYFEHKEYKNTLAQIVSMSRQHSGKNNWIVYQEIDKNIFHLLIPVNSYEEINENAALQLNSISGLDEALRREFYLGIKHYQTFLLSEVPNCGNAKVRRISE